MPEHPSRHTVNTTIEPSEHPSAIAAPIEIRRREPKSDCRDVASTMVRAVEAPSIAKAVVPTTQNSGQEFKMRRHSGAILAPRVD